MNYIDRFNTINDLTKNDIYVIKNGHSNVLFLGGCRTFVYIMFFEEICKHMPYFIHAQFGIQTIAVHIIDLLKRGKTNNMKNAIENADIIICEQSRNYNILNTSKKCVENIFNNFNIKSNCKIVQVPNLEYFKNTENVIDIDRLTTHCKKYGFNNVSNMIINNPIEKLFVTSNHPKNVLLLEAFKELFYICFDQKIPFNILVKLSIIEVFI